jgi:hypothetical protein
MKKFTLNLTMAFTAICCCASLNAQTVIKVGAGQGDKQKTIQMAYDSIVPATLAEAYVLEIQSDYDPAAEVYPINLKAKTGASATNNITIKPATGVKKVLSTPSVTKIYKDVAFESGVKTIILPNVTDIKVGQTVYGIGLPASVGSNPYLNDTIQAVDAANNTITFLGATTSLQTATTLFIGKTLTQTILFNGAKYVTIDGVSRTGNTGLTIQNPNLINCQVVMFTAGSQYNTIKNCFIKGANQSGQINNGTSGQIFFNTGENDFNTIDNNDICDIDDLPMPICMVTFSGISGCLNNDNTISNNYMYNLGTGTAVNGNAGFFQFPSGNGTNTHHNYILNNRMYWTKPATMNTGISCIGVGGSHNGEGNRIEGNVIGYASPDGTGVANITALTSSAGLEFAGIKNAKNTTIKNNTIGGINLSVKGFLGITTQAYSSTSVVADDYFNGNIVKDITINSTANGSYATSLSVNTQSAFAANVKNNTVDNIVITSGPSYSCTATGIDVGGTSVAASAFTYSGNKISNLIAGDDFSTSANIAYGVKINQGVTAFNKNLIYNIKAVNNTNTAIIRGLQTAGSATGQLISNNIIRIGNFVSGDASITAMYQGAGSSVDHAVKIYNNTIYIGGQAPATAIKPTFGFFHTGLAPKNDLQNNIIANNRKIGNPLSTSKEAHYAIQVVTELEIAKSDYNIYQFGKFFGNTSATDAESLELWASAFSSTTNIFDAHSKVADPLFVAPDADVPNMKLQETSPAKGTGVALTDVTVDFNGFSRTTMDIGALAYGSVASVKSTIENKLQVYTTKNNIVVNNQMGQIAQVYSLSGQLVKTAVLQSDKESISVNNGFYIIRINSLVSKVLVK